MGNKCNGTCQRIDDCTCEHCERCHTPTVDSSVDWEDVLKIEMESGAYGATVAVNAMYQRNIKTFISANRQSLITRIKGEVEMYRANAGTHIEGDYDFGCPECAKVEALTDVLARLEEKKL